MARLMKAAVLKGWGVPLAIEKVPMPEPGPGELLVRIKASGVCHTDVHQWRGDWPSRRAMMEANNIRIIGHEGVGIVEEVGLGVTRFKPGDRVGVPVLNYFCGACEYCQSGEPQRCEQAKLVTYHVNGTHAEYATIHERAAPRIPKELSDVEAAPFMDAGVTVYSAVRKLVKEVGLPAGKPIAIVGAAGGLGHYAVQIAKAFGYLVVGIDVGEERTRFVEKFGADYAVEANSAERFIRDKFGGVYAVVVVAPVLAGYELGLRLLRPSGALMAVGLPAESEGNLPITPRSLIALGVKIIPTMVGSTLEIEELLRLAALGKVKSHIAKIAPLEEINTVLRELEEGRYVGRAVLTI